MTSQTATSVHPTAASSRLLDALESAHERAVEQETISLVRESERAQRGLLGPSMPPPLPPEQALETLKKLDKVSDQIAVVKAWLQQPDQRALLFLLDKAIRDEYRQMERRTIRLGIVISALFTVVGAFIGYWLPVIIHWLTVLR